MKISCCPHRNACLAPGEWQHYRIEFTAPRFDDEDDTGAFPIVDPENRLLID